MIKFLELCFDCFVFFLQDMLEFRQNKLNVGLREFRRVFLHVNDGVFISVDQNKIVVMECDICTNVQVLRGKEAMNKILF